MEQLTPERLAAERDAIGQIVAKKYWQALSQHGVQVIHMPEEVPPVDCGGWLFPENKEQSLEEIASFYQPVESPQVGDLVLYFRTFDIEGEKKRKCLHMGKIIGENGLTESKWGPEGPVVEHNYLLVPFFYGNEIVFARSTADK